MPEWRVDAAGGEARVARINAGQIVELHLVRHTNGQRSAIAGSAHAARLIERTAVGAFGRLPSGQDVLIRGVPSALAMGASVIVQITSAAYAEPGQMKLAKAAYVPDDPVCVPNSVDFAALLAAPGCAADADMRDAIDDVLQLAQAGDIAINGDRFDGSISFVRTRAGLVCDIDGTQSLRDNGRALNCAAVAEIARLLRLFQVGGVVLIDCVGMANKADRLAVAAAFDAASVVDPRPFERTSINGFGLLQVVRARTAPSLLDTLFGTHIAALSLETQAHWLLREAERSTGAGTRTIAAQPALANLIAGTDFADARAQVAAKTGAPLDVVADAGVPRYGAVHVSPI